MKRALASLLCLAAGVATGGGAAVAVASFQPGQPAVPAAPADEPLVFVPTGAIVTPLVFEDGQLAGYVSIEAQLQVSADQADSVAARMPVLLHAVNLRTFRVPLAAGRDGQLPDLSALRRLLAASADTAFGKRTVRTIAITQARPA